MEALQHSPPLELFHLRAYVIYSLWYSFPRYCTYRNYFKAPSPKGGFFFSRSLLHLLRLVRFSFQQAGQLDPWHKMPVPQAQAWNTSLPDALVNGRNGDPQDLRCLRDGENFSVFKHATLPFALELDSLD